MRKIILSIFILLVSFSFANSEEKKPKNTELNIFTGMFDFSDTKQAAGVIGIQHQNDYLFRESFLGKLSPITGGFLTENSAVYLYTGAQAEYDFGLLSITTLVGAVSFCLKVILYSSFLSS